MPELRITRYDPALRDESGAFRGAPAWTSISDARDSASMAEYLHVESAYLDTALAFFEEAGIDHLVIRWHPDEINPPADYRQGQVLRLPELRVAMQRMLREELWAELDGERGAFARFGYDLYMYLGVPVECPRARALAATRGLFVEDWRSPYPPRSRER